MTQFFILERRLRSWRRCRHMHPPGIESVVWERYTEWGPSPCPLPADWCARRPARLNGIPAGRGQEDHQGRLRLGRYVCRWCCLRLLKAETFKAFSKFESFPIIRFVATSPSLSTYNVIQRDLRHCPEHLATCFEITLLHIWTEICLACTLISRLICFVDHLSNPDV